MLSLFKKKTTTETKEKDPNFKVPFTQILAINPHGNAERLEIATVFGFQVVVQKGIYKVGESVIYAPIDCLLPQWLEDKLFPADSKIKLHNHRIRQIRIRGLASQGMLIDPEDIYEKTGRNNLDGSDLSEAIGITKYEPPVAGPSQTIGKGRNRNKKQDHPLFHKYNGVNNIKWFPNLFTEGEEVCIQEKLHGTNARASVLPYVANTFWKKVKKWFRIAPATENCYGSNNVDISAATFYKGYYGEDVYGAVFKALGIFKKIKLGEIVYGEIIGPNIQKNYTYGLTENKFVVFDVKLLQEDGSFVWQTPSWVKAYCASRGFDWAPELYAGPYKKELAYNLTKGNSRYCPTQKVREGIVIKAAEGYSVEGNKKACKWVSEEYLDDKSNSDNH